MADEKDKITSDFLKAVATKSDVPETPAAKAVREYLDALLRSTPLKSDTDSDLSAVLKALAERGKPFGTAEQLSALLEILDPGTAARKRAAETNQVDESLANEWFKQHWKDRTCGICKEVTWALAPTFAHVPMNLIWRHAPVHTFPCVVLTCRVCGNTLFFNANAMKLLPEGSE
jgi:hypothetical protein